MSADDGTERFWWYEAMNCPDKTSSCLTMWQWIHIAALIPATFSIIASIFIIITGIKYHTILSNLTFGAKLPIFISFCDLGWEIFHSGDHIHNLIQGYVTEDFWCILCGCMKPFSINCQTAWTIAVSVYLNRSIFDDSCTEPKFGPHNIYLHGFCWGMPTIILIIGFIFNVYGIEGPWCGIKDPMTDVYMVDIWMIVAILVLIINYGWIMYKLHKVTIHHGERKDSNTAVIEANKRIKRIIKTIGLYPVAYFIQWLAYCLYKTNVVPRTFETALWVVTTGNAGGIFNLFLYGPLLLNQIKREKINNENMISAGLATPKPCNGRQSVTAPGSLDNESKTPPTTEMVSSTSNITAPRSASIASATPTPQEPSIEVVESEVP